MANTSAPPPALESLDRFVQWATETAQIKGPKIVDWLYTEVPDVIHEFLAWHFVYSLALFVLGVFLAFGIPIICFQIARKFYISLDVKNWHDEGPFWFGSIISSALINLICQLNCWTMINLSWLKIWLAPKVFLLETFANVIK